MKVMSRHPALSTCHWLGLVRLLFTFFSPRVPPVSHVEGGLCSGNFTVMHCV